MSEQTLGASFEVHITCATIIILLGFFTNGLLLFIYFKTKESKHVGNVYLVTLAILDQTACFSSILIPILKLSFENSSDSTYIFLFNSFSCIRSFIRINNLNLSGLMAIDRLWAIFRPFTYKRFISHAKTIIAVFVILSLIEIISFASLPRSILMTFIGFHVLLGFLAIFTAYPVIAYRLNIRDKRRIEDELRQTNGDITAVPNKRYVFYNRND